MSTISPSCPSGKLTSTLNIANFEWFHSSSKPYLAGSIIHFHGDFPYLFILNHPAIGGTPKTQTSVGDIRSLSLSVQERVLALSLGESLRQAGEGATFNVWPGGDF